MPARYLGRNDKRFQETMGNGAIMVHSLPKREQQPSGTSSERKPLIEREGPAYQLTPEEMERRVAESKAFGMKLFEEASPVSGYEPPSPSGKTDE